ncbi:hypothetical protein K7G98_30600, partial [Saccharothrix sp. MB29]|nr:hypothetical protein [Saccharothrix sp. MB29]
VVGCADAGEAASATRMAAAGRAVRRMWSYLPVAAASRDAVWAASRRVQRPAPRSGDGAGVGYSCRVSPP